MVRTLKLQARDKAIFEHLRRYRITTTEVLKEVFYAEKEVDAVKSTLRRLRDGGYLRSVELRSPFRFYQLTKMAVRKLGFHHGLALPIGEQALRESFGVLHFCCLGATPRTRLTTDELVSHFPKLFGTRTNERAHYIHDDGEKKRLACVVVDHGSSKQHIHTKCGRLVEQRSKNRAWQKLVFSDEVMLAVITPTLAKAKGLDQLHSEKPLPVQVFIEAVPSLNGIL